MNDGNARLRIPGVSKGKQLHVSKQGRDECSSCWVGSFVCFIRTSYHIIGGLSSLLSWLSIYSHTHRLGQNTCLHVINRQ